MKVRWIFATALVALLVALGAGCGGDDGGGGGETTTSTQATEPAGGAETTSVKMDEYSFDPKDVTAKRGDTIKVENDGAIAHNLTVEQGPDPKEKSKKLAGTSTFLPGKTENLKVDLKPGKYAMVCTVSGHRELGMAGTFTVK
jgi:plastocyanin